MRFILDYCDTQDGLFWRRFRSLLPLAPVRSPLVSAGLPPGREEPMQPQRLVCSTLCFQCKNHSLVQGFGFTHADYSFHVVFPGFPTMSVLHLSPFFTHLYGQAAFYRLLLIVFLC